MYVKCVGASENVLRAAFSKYWEVQSLFIDASKRSVPLSGYPELSCVHSTSFITFKSPAVAETAVKEVGIGCMSVCAEVSSPTADERRDGTRQ